MLSANENETTLTICTINAQSLIAHSEDIQTDSVSNSSNILVITETWMPETSPSTIDNFELIIASNQQCRNERGRRMPGGVAIYENIHNCPNVSLIDSEIRQISPKSTGDVVFAKFDVDGTHEFTLCGLYLHPGLSKNRTQNFLTQALDF